VECFLCGEENIRLSEMVEHVGRHILHVSRNANAPEELVQQPGANPCGFCGRDGCLTQLEKVNNKTLVIASTCPYRRSKMLPSKRYNEFDASSPCSNTPIYCSLC
ncbi:hypothetical protein FA15DRAFT_547372, partial [Coprinopsis marcescibilis]